MSCATLRFCAILHSVMRRDADSVEIRHPPIREFSRKKSCAKRACTAGCLFIVLGAIAVIAILKYLGAPRPRELKMLPPEIGSRLPLYDAKNLEKIVFTSGENRRWVLERAALAPKLLLSPVIIAKERGLSASGTVSWGDFVALMKRPVAKTIDTYEVSWADLSARPKFIADYYEQEFIRLGWTISNMSISEEVRQFSAATSSIIGSIFIRDATKSAGTDAVIITVRAEHTQ